MGGQKLIHGNQYENENETTNLCTIAIKKKDKIPKDKLNKERARVTWKELYSEGSQQKPQTNDLKYIRSW